MSVVVHKTTFAVLQSVHTPDYEPSTWLHNPPGLDSLKNVPKRYWKLSASGDDLEEQDANEKSATDSSP